MLIYEDGQVPRSPLIGMWECQVSPNFQVGHFTGPSPKANLALQLASQFSKGPKFLKCLICLHSSRSGIFIWPIRLDMTSGEHRFHCLCGIVPRDFCDFRNFLFDRQSFSPRLTSHAERSEACSWTAGGSSRSKSGCFGSCLDRLNIGLGRPVNFMIPVSIP